MTNFLYQEMNKNNAQNNNFTAFFQEVQRLKNVVNNPKKEVERLLSSGQMSQQQFNQFAQMANQLSAMLPK